MTPSVDLPPLSGNAAPFRCNHLRAAHRAQTDRPLVRTLRGGLQAREGESPRL